MSATSKLFISSTNGYEHDDRWTAVDAYAHPHLNPKHNAYAAMTDSLLQEIADSGLPDDSTYPAFGKFLALQCRAAKARQVLEVGTLGGYTAIWIAIMNPECQITSLEVDPYHAEVARRNINKAGVGHRCEIIVGPALETLPKLQAQVQAGRRPHFEFTFIDADKENNWAYMDMAVDMSAKGATVIVDNVVRRAFIVTDEKLGDSRVQGARLTIESAGKDPRVDCTVLQQVSEKNYDGFLMAIVK